MTSRVIVFDVNETLLDLRALAPRFEKLLPVDLMGLWFSRMLRNSLVAVITGEYAPFDRQGVDALLTTARSAGVDVTEAEASEVIAGMSELPAHPDAAPALEQLGDAGYRMATLTNSTLPVATAQIENAGLSGFFEQLISVDEIGVFKPALETYRFAAHKLGVPVVAMRLVAAHDWDVSGAIRAGARAAFVARTGATLGPMSETPEIIEPDLVSVARTIRMRDRAAADELDKEGTA